MSVVVRGLSSFLGNMETHHYQHHHLMVTMMVGFIIILLLLQLLSVPDTMLNTLQTSSVIFITTSKVDFINLKLIKVLRERKSVFQGHTTGELQSGCIMNTYFAG